ncbi:MAG TPA: hypothetical protein VJ839_05580 [Candidatus Limnocylindria bacterium]|nr:hypothetical protein [Candidatus Limnocylindria bacterium]
MRETPEEVAELHALLDRTTAKVNPHFAGIVTVAFFRINPTATWTYAGKPKDFPAST